MKATTLCLPLLLSALIAAVQASTPSPEQQLLQAFSSHELLSHPTQAAPDAGPDTLSFVNCKTRHDLTHVLPGTISMLFKGRSEALLDVNRFLASKPGKVWLDENVLYLNSAEHGVLAPDDVPDPAVDAEARKQLRTLLMQYVEKLGKRDVPYRRAQYQACDADFRKLLQGKPYEAEMLSFVASEGAASGQPASTAALTDFLNSRAAAYPEVVWEDFWQQSSGKPPAKAATARAQQYCAARKVWLQTMLPVAQQAMPDAAWLRQNTAYVSTKSYQQLQNLSVAIDRMLSSARAKSASSIEKTLQKARQMEGEAGPALRMLYQRYLLTTQAGNALAVFERGNDPEQRLDRTLLQQALADCQSGR